MALRAPRGPTAGIDEAIGFVGFFGAVFLVVTVFCELTGRPALGWALTLLVCVLALVALWRWRVAVLRRSASRVEASAADGARLAGPSGARAAGPTGARVSGPDPDRTAGPAGVGRDQVPGGPRVGNR